MDKTEQEHLAQLGKDRRLAEAVGNLDLAAAELTRIAGDENSPAEAVMQAAADYRAAIQRREDAYNKAAGVEEGHAVETTITVEPPDEDAVREVVEKVVAERLDEREANAREPVELGEKKSGPVKEPEAEASLQGGKPDHPEGNGKGTPSGKGGGS